MKIVLVAEAYGDRELRFNHPLVGPSGRELARMLAESGLGPELRQPYPTEGNMISHWALAREEPYSLAVTNVFSAQPVNNDIEIFFDKAGNRDLPPLRAGKYIRPEYMPHVIRLWDEIRTLAPNLVVLLGNSACWALLGQTKITSLRGTVQMSQRLDIKCIPTFHPAAVLRQWSMRPTVIADFIKARKESEYGEIRRVERWITIPTADASGLTEIAQWLNHPATIYANDIETAFGQISMLSFARDLSHAMVIPFHNPDGSSFWPEPDLEVSAWKLALRGLRRAVPKVGQNYMYDMSYYARLGVLPAMPREDTMLHHHAIYPELQKSLGYLGSIYCREIPWKTMSGHSRTLKRDE